MTSQPLLRDRPKDGDIAERTFPEAPAPPQLVCNLLPFQRESLFWMTNQERSVFRGGILADEMGLGKQVGGPDYPCPVHQVGKAGHVGAPGSHARPHGHVSAGKTVQSIALILANRTDPVTGGTCVAPPRDYVSDGCVAVLKTAHKATEKAAKKAATAAAKAAKKAAGGSKGGEPGADEAVAAATAAEAPASGTLADVLLAPPSPHAPPELVAAAAPFVAAWKPLVSMRSALSSLAPAEPCGATLVICPVVALSQWRAELARHTAPGSLRVLVYHGANRELSAAELSAYDVVLTTYSTLEVEFRKMLAPTKVRGSTGGQVQHPQWLEPPAPSSAVGHVPVVRAALPPGKDAHPPALLLRARRRQD